MRHPLNSQPDNQLPSSLPREFITTHWSAVLLAAGEISAEADRALEELCRAYWYPLYAYVRRQGHSAEDAQDLTQEFFARLLEHKYVRLADPQRGRFRTFLLSSLKNFLINEWKKARTIKRGGDERKFSLDAEQAEFKYSQEPADEMAPDRIFERRWAIALIESVLTQLRAEYVAIGKVDLFEELKGHVWGEGGAYAEAAARLKTTEGALRIGAHRLREQFRRVLRQQVARTVAAPHEIEAELRHLISVLQTGSM